LFIGFIRDISDRKEEAERQQRILQESEHRVKNMLTVVQAIALQTAANSADMASFTTSFSGRLESLARAHQLLVGQVWQDVAISSPNACSAPKSAPAARASAGPNCC
jgi:two-component sensor histidine kinase